MDTNRKVIRMSQKQFNTACSIIRGQCCNYDTTTGGCLLLDHGEVVQCPQLITQSLVCRYFRDVLLEDKRNKAFKAEVMGEDFRKVCQTCGEHFRAVAPQARFCAQKRRLERQREYMKSKRT